MCFLVLATHLSHLPKEIPLKQLVSGSPHLLDRSLSDVKETEKDYSSQNTLITVCAVSITFVIGVTISLILHIYFLESLVCHVVKHMEVYHNCVT